MKKRQSEKVCCVVNNICYYAPPPRLYNQKVWTVKELRIAIDLYVVKRQGINKVAKAVNCGTKTIQALLRYNKAKIEKFSSLTQQQIKERAKKEYVEGVAILTIAKNCKVRGAKITKLVKEGGWERGCTNEKYFKYRKTNTLLRLCTSPFSSYSEYMDLCRRATAITFNVYTRLIDPLNLKSKGYHLDHKLSLFEGYRYKIPVIIMAHPMNLVMLEARENSVKRLNSSIDRETLNKLIDIFEEELGPNILGEIYAKSPANGFYHHRIVDEYSINLVNSL